MLALLSLATTGYRVAVFGGTGLVGSRCVKALSDMDVEVVSVSRSGAPPEWASGAAWTSSVRWVAADAEDEEAVAESLSGGVDCVVSCIGSAGRDLLAVSADGWSGWSWTDMSKRAYAVNYEPNVNVVAAAKAAGAQRFVYVGASSDAEQGFAGPNPGLYTGKRAVALAAQEAFGDSFTYFGPHQVVESAKDPRLKFAKSGIADGLRAFNDVIGEIRSFGTDFTTKTRLAPPVVASTLALAMAASATGRVDVEPSMRSAGMTTFSETYERDQYEIQDLLCHVDGTEAITALAERAEAAGLGAPEEA